jgi:fructose-1-phosphate kinase PfkB-like protein
VSDSAAVAFLDDGAHRSGSRRPGRHNEVPLVTVAHSVGAGDSLSAGLLTRQPDAACSAR